MSPLQDFFDCELSLEDRMSGSNRVLRRVEFVSGDQGGFVIRLLGLEYHEAEMAEPHDDQGQTYDRRTFDGFELSDEHHNVIIGNGVTVII